MAIKVYTFRYAGGRSYYIRLPDGCARKHVGEKVYFSTPVSVAQKADAKAVVKAVELVYRQDSDDNPDCVVSTSISEGDEIRLASTFNIR